MITDDPRAFAAFARTLPADWPALPRAAFLVTPDGLALAPQSASDNRYMDLAQRVDGERALAQHRALQQALARMLPAIAFPGDPATPDAVFPNNVFATAPGRLLIARMRHPVRQREAERSDIPRFFTEVLGYEVVDLRGGDGVGELTGSLVIDRARGIGLCGLSARCDAQGAAAMHAAFGLRATLCFALTAGEYHANVVASVLAGRALVLCADGLADPELAPVLATLYPHTVLLDGDERRAFAGNCIALSADTVWMSATGAAALRGGSRDALARAGFALATVPLDEIEKAGGSLRCCVGEIY